MAFLNGCYERSSRRSSWSQSRPHGCALVLVWHVWFRRCCVHGRSCYQLPYKGSVAFPGTGIGSGDAAPSDCLYPSARSRPPVPAAAEKWMLGVVSIGMYENALKIILAEQLPQHRLLIVFAGGVAGLADRHTQSVLI